jgi:uncharacterized SAM-binding protein YcdF (DUF218 family)
MHWLIPKLISSVLLLPFNLLILFGVGIVLLPRRPRLGRNLIIIAWLALWALSTPVISATLLQSLENTPALQLDQLPTDVDAIVVLSGGTYCIAPEYGKDTVGPYTLERIRYAAELYRRTGKPVLVTGGKLSNPIPEAIVMKETLEHDFHVPVRWLEEQSHDTMENARFSAAVVKNQGVRRIFLVTHAAHIPRAQAAFQKAGFEVIPAPIRFTTRCRLTPLGFLPTSSALAGSAAAFHEWIGLVWYQLR